MPADRIGGGRIRLTGLRAENVLVVALEQTETDSQQGVHRTVDPSDDRVYVWTSFEPDEARRCWACFDQPDLKAPHAFTVLAPASWTVLSCSAVEEVTAHGDARRWVFPDTPPLSTYVVVVNAGPFHERRSTRDGHDLGLLCRRSLAAQLDRDAEGLFSLTAAGLAFFGERFGMPFPQVKYDNVFVPDSPGAMENWGCVTWGDGLLYRTTPTRRERAFRAEVLLHELAHMWFGDLVTMQWWDDLWLNEAFASWAALWASTRVSEFTDAWATFVTYDKPDGYAADRAVTRHPIRQPADDVAEGTASFDDITYVKGASVLKQLVALVGEDAFVTALRDYFARHAFGNTTLADLTAAVGRAAGRDLGAWTDAWLDRAGTDRLELRQLDGAWTVLASAPDLGPPRSHRLDVGVYSPAPDGRWRRTALVAVETSGERTPLRLDGHDLADDVLLLVNDEDQTFAHARPDPASLARMLAGAAGLPTPMARAVAATTAWDLVTEAEVSTAAFVRCAVDVVAVETDAGVANDLLRLLRRSVELWAAPGDQAHLQTLVADACAELVDDPDLGDTARRTLARTAVSSKHLGPLRRHVHDDTQLHWDLLVRLAELGGLDVHELERLSATDADPDAWLRSVQVRAALPDRAAKEDTWRAVFAERTIPANQFRLVGEAFWRPTQHDLLADYPDRYLGEVATLAGPGMLLELQARSFFPWVVAGRSFLRDLEHVTAREGLHTTLRRSLSESADALARMLRAREA